MKKSLLLVIIMLLFSSLFGWQRCTICSTEVSKQKRTLADTPVSGEAAQQEEKSVFQTFDADEYLDFVASVNSSESPSAATPLEDLQQRCRAPHPHVVAENPYVVQPVPTTSFKAFRDKRDYNIEYSEDIPGERAPNYVYSGDVLFRTSMLTRGDSILLENPTLRVTPISQPESVFVETAFRRQYVNFKSGQVAAALSLFDRRDAHFPRFTKDYRTSISFEGQHTVHTFTMDFPDKSVPYRDHICRWLSQLVTESYVGDPDQVDSVAYHTSRHQHPGRWRYQSASVTAARLGQFSSTRYFTFKKMQYGGPFDAYTYLISVYDWRLCLRNDRFLTYQQYLFDFDGGAHGGYFSSLRSYDFVHQEEIDSNYLFLPECMDSVKGLLLEAASCNEVLLEKENIQTQEQLFKSFERSAGISRAATIAKMRLPSLGLSETGVVFSYPPYALGAYSSGNFHFVIPYGRLLPYLTPKAKWCLNLR